MGVFSPSLPTHRRGSLPSSRVGRVCTHLTKSSADEAADAANDATAAAAAAAAAATTAATTAAAATGANTPQKQLLARATQQIACACAAIPPLEPLPPT